MTYAYRMVPINEIKIRKDWNIRSEIRQLELNGLMASIKRVGLTNPITLNADMELVAGYRRYYACEGVGMVEIPCHVVHFDNDYLERLAHIDENLESKSLSENDLERALFQRKQIYEALYPRSTSSGHRTDDKPDSFIRSASEKLDRSETTIRKMISRVEDLSDKCRAAYEAGSIGAQQADELTRLSMPLQDALLDEIVGLSVAETRLLVDDMLKSDEDGESPRPRKEKKPKQAKWNTEKDPTNLKDPAVEIDTAIADAILDAEKVIRLIKTADYAVDGFLKRKYYQKLDNNYSGAMIRCIADFADKAGYLLESLKARDDETTEFPGE